MSRQHSGDPIGLFHTWWRGDPLPDLGAEPGLMIEPVDGDRLTTAMPWLDEREVRDREQQGHRPYLARHKGGPVAYGWSATATASIGELGITLELPPGNRYLWDFVTLPEWRGRRIYPRMLQSIIQHEAEVERFWVGHDYSNVASARGIARAGFCQTGALYRLPDGSFALVPGGTRGDGTPPVERTIAAAALLKVPVAGVLRTDTL